MTHDGHSDDRYLGFTFETEKAIRVLTDLRDLGYDHVSIRQMLVFALSKIEHRQEKLEKMKHLLSREIFYAKKNSLIISEFTFREISCAKKATGDSRYMSPL